MAQITLNSTGVASDGALVLQSNGTTAAVTIDTSQRAAFVAGTAALPAITTTGDTNTGIFFPAADTIAFSEGGVESMRIDASGNMGLAVTPSAWNSAYKSLDINTRGFCVAGASDAGTISINSFFDSGSLWKYKGTSSARVTRYDQYDGSHIWYNAAAGTAGNTISFTQAMTLDASGNLGIGTTSPSGRFDAQNNQNATSNFYFRNTDTTNTSSRAALNVVAGAQSFGFLAINGDNTYIQRTSASLQFQLAGSTQATLDSSGNLLVGTTNSSASAGNGFKINPNGIGSGIPQISIVGNSTDNSYGTYSIYSSSAAQYQFYVGYGGTVYARSTSITGLSDQREKENIRTLDVGLNEVLSLQPRRFDWKDGSALNVAGFVAQEVQQVLPDLIEEYKINDEENRLGLKMGDMIPTLVKAIQEQQAIITQLQADVAALKGTA